MARDNDVLKVKTDGTENEFIGRQFRIDVVSVIDDVSTEQNAFFAIAIASQHSKEM